MPPASHATRWIMPRNHRVVLHKPRKVPEGVLQHLIRGYRSWAARVSPRASWARVNGSASYPETAEESTTARNASTTDSPCHRHEVE